MDAAALPAPTTTVRPAGGRGRCGGTAVSAAADSTAASNISRNSARSSMGIGLLPCEFQRRGQGRPPGLTLSFRGDRLADFVAGQAFQDPHHSRMIPSRAASGDGGVEQLLADRGVGQADAKTACALKGEVQILLMQRDTKAGLEIALDHPLAMYLEDSRIGKAAHQGLAHPRRIGSCFGSEQQRLTDRLDGEGDDDLVSDL